MTENGEYNYMVGLIHGIDPNIVRQGDQCGQEHVLPARFDKEVIASYHPVNFRQLLSLLFGLSLRYLLYMGADFLVQ